MAQMAHEDGFQFITRAGLDEAATQSLASAAAAHKLIDDLIAADPSLQRLAPVAPTESPTLRRTADGNYRLSMDDEAFVVHGTDWLYQETAVSLSLTAARANREADYRSLIDLLPGDQLTDLPASDALGALTDDALTAAHQELVRRVETLVPNEPFGAGVTVAALKPRLPALRYFPGTGCNNHQTDNLYATLDWPMKPYTTPVRKQSQRGTCTAHAVVGALEARVFRTRGIQTDYSEQELYAVAKGTWFPTSDAYGEGLQAADVLEKLQSSAGRIDAEMRWPYNKSSSRIDDEDARTYTHSCDGYSGYCSNTNHQMKIVCSGTGAARVCGTRLPPGVTGAGTDPVQLTGWVSLWNGLEPENSLASIRAHLNSGHPVVLAIEADDLFVDAANRAPSSSGSVLGPGNVNWTGGGEAIGGHELVIVGYVANGQLPANAAAPDGFGGGYLIGKNSWGCKGDGGYMYLAYDWVIDQTRAAFAVTSVATTAVAPAATLAVDKSLVSAPGNVQFTVSVTASTTKVEIFRGLGTDHAILSKTLPGDAPAVVTAIDGFIDGGQNGIYIYWARATDQFGTAVASAQTGVRVQIDDLPPQVQLSVDSDHVLAPGQVVLHATAQDNIGVARVKFYRGFQLLGQDTTAPFTMTHTVLPGDVGTWTYVAVAFDAAGNQKMSQSVTVTVIVTPRPLIASFTATPSTLTQGGGQAMLSWNVAGATTVAISPGVGAVAKQGATMVTLTQSTTYVLTASNSAGTTTASAAIVVTVVPPPIITTFTATPSSLPPSGGTTTLAWAVLGAGTTLAIDHGVGDVTGLTSKSVIVSASTTFRLTATNVGGTSTRDVTVTVAATGPPVIGSFVANPASLPAGGGQSTLSWSVVGTQPSLAIDQGVGDVTGLTSKSVSVGATTTYRLTATNAAGTVTRDVTVTVEGLGAQSVYASPAGDDTGNDCQTEATPCKTIAHAVTQAGAGGTAWLLDGTYTESPCGGCTEIAVPTGLTVRAKNPGGARLGSKMVMTGGTLAEIVIDRTIGYARVRLTAGTTALEGVRWKGAFAGVGQDVGLDLSGAAIAVLTPGAAANYAAETTSENTAYTALIELHDTAQLTVQGGTFDGPGVGFGSNPGTNASPGAFVVANSAILTFMNATIRPVNRGISVMNNATVNLVGSTLEARAMTSAGFGIKVNNNSNSTAPETAHVVVADSQITGFASLAIGAGTGTNAAISVSTYNGSNDSSGAVTLTNSTLSGNALGVYVDGQSLATIQGQGLHIDDNQVGGIRAVGNLTIDVAGGSLSRNGFLTATGIGSLAGGMTVGSGTYHVRLRGVAIVDNRCSVVTVNTSTDSGLTLAGDATSTFDLGTAADPGGNIITGNTTSGATTGIDVKVNAAVTVMAVGNTFAPGIQGADASGHYLVGTAPCGATACDVTTGAGANYRVTTGTLRLAQ